MFKVILDRAAEKDLDKIPIGVHKKIFVEIGVLQGNPFYGKRLRGNLHGCYSWRVWPYRLIYRIYKREQRIQIIRIAHRQGVY